MDVHIETIGLQQDYAHQTLERILPHIDKDLHGVNLSLVPVLTCKIDDSIESRLRKVVIKHNHVSRNIKHT